MNSSQLTEILITCNFRNLTQITHHYFFEWVTIMSVNNGKYGGGAKPPKLYSTPLKFFIN